MLILRNGVDDRTQLDAEKAVLQALYQPQGGILNSEEGIQAHVQAALAHGTVLHTSEKVRSWRVPSSGQVEADTDRGRYTADKLVLTAGAWMPEVVPELKLNADIADALTWPILSTPHHAPPVLQSTGQPQIRVAFITGIA